MLPNQSFNSSSTSCKNKNKVGNSLYSGLKCTQFIIVSLVFGTGENYAVENAHKWDLFGYSLNKEYKLLETFWHTSIKKKIWCLAQNLPLRKVFQSVPTKLG